MLQAYGQDQLELVARNNSLREGWILAEAFDIAMVFPFCSRFFAG